MSEPLTNATEIVLQFIEALDAAGVQYMLVGSYSSNYYGRPRSTKDADFVVQIDDDHDKERFGRKRQAMFEGRPVWLPTAEDVVITKLRWSRAGARAKDAADVAGILAVQHQSLDLAYIRQWIDRHGTRELFEPLLIAASRQ